MFQDDLKRRQKGTGFTNIGRILGANVGAGQQMAGRIAQGIQAAGQNVQQRLGQAQQQFKTGFQAATQPALGSLAAGSALIKQPGESEEAYSERIKSGKTPGLSAQQGQPIDYSEIGKQVQQAKYTGPSGIEDQKNLLGAAVGAGQLGGLSSSAAGQGLLAKQFLAGRQGYSAGQSALDQLLMGQSTEAQRQLQEARQSVGDIAEKTREAIQSAEAQASGMEKGIEKEKSRVLGGVQKSVGELEQRAKEKAQMYSRDASRLIELLRDPTKLGKAVTDKGTQFSEQRAAADRELLKNIKQFGIDAGVKIDTSNAQDMISALQEIANKGTSGIVSKYGEAQKGALQRLAEFQQDPGRAAQLAAQKDKAAFALSGEDIESLTPIKKQAAASTQEKADIEKGQKFQNFASEYQKILDETRNMPRGATKVRQQYEDAKFVELGLKHGFSPEEINRLAGSVSTKGQAGELLWSEANRLIGENTAKQQARAANQMALQDYINRLYGIR